MDMLLLAFIGITFIFLSMYFLYKLAEKRASSYVNGSILITILLQVLFIVGLVFLVVGIVTMTGF